MIDPSDFFDILNENEIKFFSGVPDSLLKPLCSYLLANTENENHVIAANEGGAIASGIGYYLSTGKIPMIYMQNSGIGNAINPLLSLVDQTICSIPMLLCIGWRGEPGIKDEPQHIKQGKVTTGLLDLMEIPYSIISSDHDIAISNVLKAVSYFHNNKSPYALLFKKNSFSDYKFHQKVSPPSMCTREDVVKIVADIAGENSLIVATTGKLSRELYEYRDSTSKNHGADFLTVGGMGHASQIASIIALKSPKKKVVCLDGDGSMIMHLGSLAINASFNSSNFKHVVINNGAHDSVGGQPTVASKLDLGIIAKSLGYNVLPISSSLDDIQKNIQVLLDSNGPVFLEVKVKKGSRLNLGRPSISPLENARTFMKTAITEFESA